MPFLPPVALAGASRAVVGGSAESSDVTWNHGRNFHSFPMEHFHKRPSWCWGVLPHPWFSEGFCHQRVLPFGNAFPASAEMTVSFVLSSTVTCDVWRWFSRARAPWRLWRESHLVACQPFHGTMDSGYYYFVEDFAWRFMTGLDFWLSILWRLNMALAWGKSWLNGMSWKAFSPLLFSSKSLRRIGVNFSLDVQ